MDMKSLGDVLDEVVKNQKLVNLGYNEAIDQVENEIQEAVNKIQFVDDQPSIDRESVFTDLKKKLETIWPQGKLKESKNELDESLTKYQKILGKLFDNDVSKAYADVDFYYKTINQIIVSSLYHDGLFHIADVFLEESQVKDNVSLRTQFTRMRYIIKALRARELEPALTWVLVNREKLNRNGSKLVFDLQRFQYLEIVQKGNKADAMKYFNAHLKPFSSNRSTEVIKLMGSLLWCGKLENSSYSKLLSLDKWDDLVKEFTKEFCNLIGVSLKNPLSVTLEAGAQALPTLLKLARVMSLNKMQKWGTMNKLPVGIDLGSELQFHSVFVCPVTGEESVAPHILPCRHVISLETINGLSKGRKEVFNCPLCESLPEAAEDGRITIEFVELYF